MADIRDNLFDNDLIFGNVTVFKFSPKMEFEMQSMFKKITKLADDTDYMNDDFILEKVPFENVEKIGKWMDENTDINKSLTKSGDLVSKTLVFIYMFLDYADFKKKLKVAQFSQSKVDNQNETVKVVD